MNSRMQWPLLAVLLAAPAAAADGTAAAWAVKLRSDKPSDWRIAQAYLAHAGEEALPELEKLADGAGEPLKRRLGETVSLMLRNSAGPASIRKHAKLWTLFEPEWRKASDPLGKLAGSEKYESGETGLMPPGAPLPRLSPARQAVEDLLGLRGFAVPAALELLADKRPGSRMYGVEILFRLNAVGQYPALRRMLDDAGRIGIWRGDYMQDTTVGQAIAEGLKSGLLRPASAPDEKYAVCFGAENYADWLDVFAGGAKDRFDLINRLRQEAKTLDAGSWDDYWRRAKPVLEAAWDHK